METFDSAIAYSSKGKVPKSVKGSIDSVTAVLEEEPPPAHSKLVRTVCHASGLSARDFKPAITSALSIV